MRKNKILTTQILLIIPHVIKNKYISTNEYVKDVFIKQEEDRKIIRIVFTNLKPLPYRNLLNEFQKEPNAYRDTICNGELVLDFLIPIAKETLITYSNVLEKSCADGLLYWAA